MKEKFDQSVLMYQGLIWNKATNNQPSIWHKYTSFIHNGSKHEEGKVDRWRNAHVQVWAQLWMKIFFLKIKSFENI